jgi:hypothetical protein
MESCLFLFRGHPRPMGNRGTMEADCKELLSIFHFWSCQNTSIFYSYLLFVCWPRLLRRDLPGIKLEKLSISHELRSLSFLPGICHSKSGFSRLSCLDRFSILTVTNMIHDPFQDVDRLGLAISQFEPGFLGNAYFVRVVAKK